MSSDDEANKPKKRQRMSVVCLNCKARKIKCDKKRPSCTNCIKCNVGHLCRYEAPHWVNRVINAEGKAKLDNDSASDHSRLLPQYISGRADTSNGGGAGTVGGNDSTNTSNNNEIALQEEIKKLRSRLESIESAIVQPPDMIPRVSGGARREYEDDIIDFYGSYNSLTIKRSCMEDHKPLCSSAIIKKDHYLSLVAGYFFLCNLLRGAIRSKKEKAARNRRLDASLLMCLELLGEQESPFLKDIISKFVEERFNSEDPKNLLLPLTSLTNISKPLYINELRSDIEKMLPPKPIINLYLDRFFKYVYPFFPSVGQHFYRERMFNLILKVDNNDNRIQLNFEDKFDFAFLATLLIFLRFSYISIGIPTTEADFKLLEYPISANYVTAAQTALSQFKIMRKTKLHIVQALFYLRTYLNYAPEDGDGQELNQSQILSGTIIQSAFTMGLNRDAEKYAHLNKFQGYVNIWRKMWLVILEMDRVGSVLSGQSPVIQNVNSYEIKFPEPMPHDGPIERAIVEELQRQQRINLLLLEISNLVNSIGVPTRVADVLAVLKQMHTYVTLNYPINKLIPLTRENEDEANYRNSRIVKQNIIIRSISLLIYQSLALHFESKEHYDLTKYQYFQSLVIETATELSDILSKYLGEDYNNYIDQNYHFYLNRLVENAISRVINAFIAILARLYHTKDMLIEAFNTNDTMIIRSINDLTSVIFRVTNGLNTASQRKLGKLYYPAFKTSLMNKFFLRSLKKDGFKCIKDTIKFFGDSTLGKDDVKSYMIQKMECEQGFSRHILKNLNNMNAFIDYRVQDYKNLIKIVEVSHILQDEELGSETALWGASFATNLQNNIGISVNHMDNNGNNDPTNNINIQNFDMVNNRDTEGILPTVNSIGSIGSGIDSSIGLVNLDQILSADVLDFESLKFETNIDTLY